MKSFIMFDRCQYIERQKKGEIKVDMSIEQHSTRVSIDHSNNLETEQK